MFKIKCGRVVKHSLFQRYSFLKTHKYFFVWLLIWSVIGLEVKQWILRSETVPFELRFELLGLLYLLFLHCGRIRSLLSVVLWLSDFAHRGGEKYILVLPSLLNLLHKDQCVYTILFLIPTQFSYLPLCMNIKRKPYFWMLSTLFLIYGYCQHFLTLISWMLFCLNSHASLFSEPSCIRCQSWQRQV